IAAVVFWLLDQWNPALVLAAGFVLHSIVIVTWSGVVEGSRRAKDRFVTSLVITAFLLALLPLVSVTWSVLDNGLSALSTDFFTTSMRNVTGLHDQQIAAGEIEPIGGIYHALM